MRSTLPPAITRALTRAVAGLGIAGLAILVVATPASAHVHVDSPDARPGEFGKLVFSVPSESETASTDKVVVSLPAGTPFASVSARSKPGWKVSLAESPLPEPTKVGDATLTKAVSTVTWTATGGGIAPEQFDEFEISVGPFPKRAAAPLEFATSQGYSDGTTVAWDEPTPASGQEPEKPAPTLDLGDSQDAGHDTSPATETRSSDTGGDRLGLGTGVVALVVALGALVVSLRGRRAVK